MRCVRASERRLSWRGLMRPEVGCVRIQFPHVALSVSEGAIRSQPGGRIALCHMRCTYRLDWAARHLRQQATTE